MYNLGGCVERPLLPARTKVWFTNNKAVFFSAASVCRTENHSRIAQLGRDPDPTDAFADIDRHAHAFVCSDRQRERAECIFPVRPPSVRPVSTQLSSHLGVRTTLACSTKCQHLYRGRRDERTAHASSLWHLFLTSDTRQQVRSHQYPTNVVKNYHFFGWGTQLKRIK